MHDSVWFGPTYVTERIVWTAMPLLSSAWKKTDIPEGTLKYAEPSFSTGTVPSMNFPVSSSDTPSTGLFICG